MSNDNKLPPCPFCESDAVAKDGVECGGRVLAASLAEAVEQWSSRTEADGQPTFWVLEWFKDEQSQGYWRGCCIEHWTRNVDDALQYRRKQDALAQFTHYSWSGYDVRPTEHLYIAPPAPPAHSPDCPNAKVYGHSDLPCSAGCPVRQVSAPERAERCGNHCVHHPKLVVNGVCKALMPLRGERIFCGHCCESEGGGNRRDGQ